MKFKTPTYSYNFHTQNSADDPISHIIALYDTALLNRIFPDYARYENENFLKDNSIE
jgi:hypothetical protein